MRIEYLADRPEFVAELAQLHHREWGALHPGQTVADRTAALRRQCGHRSIPTVLIATTDGGLIGSAMLVVHDMDSRQELSPWLAGVYVKAEFRRRGIASALIQHAEDEAAALGVEWLYLYTPDEDAFYARRGWQLLERCTYRSIAVAVMRKRLSPGAPDSRIR